MALGFTGLAWVLLGPAWVLGQEGKEGSHSPGHMHNAQPNQRPPFPHGEIGSHCSDPEPAPAVETLTLILGECAKSEIQGVQFRGCPIAGSKLAFLSEEHHHSQPRISQNRRQ